MAQWMEIWRGRNLWSPFSAIYATYCGKLAIYYFPSRGNKRLISRINWETDSLSKCQRLVFLHRSITANMHVLCRLWIHYIILLITNLTQQDFLILNTCCFFDTSPTSWKCSHVKTWPLPWNVIYNFCIYRSRSMEWELEAKDCISELFTDGKWIVALLKYSLICVKRPEYHLLSYIDKNLL